jgi:hypothetical protein
MSEQMRKPKFKFCKSGTVIVSCKGSGHRCWYRERTEAEIEGCLRDFCHNCDRRQPDCEIEAVSHEDQGAFQRAMED